MQAEWQDAEITSDGARLAARIYGAGPGLGVAGQDDAGQGGAGQGGDAHSAGVVLIHPATGAPQKIYRAFALWLAETRGVTVVTYDYRDFGASAAFGAPLARSTADKHAWGVLDQSAAVDFAFDLAGGVPIMVIGHSLGGLTSPLHPNGEKVGRLITVAAGPAHWTSHPFPYILVVMAFWFVLGPLTTLALGFTPGRRLGLGADLPSGTFWQWRRWCLTRGFYRPDVGTRLPATDFRNIKVPVKLVSLSDDDLIPPKSVAKLADFYRGGEVTHLELTPEQGGGGPIGHFGAFLPQHRSLWPLIVA